MMLRKNEQGEWITHEMLRDRNAERETVDLIGGAFNGAKVIIEKGAIGLNIPIAKLEDEVDYCVNLQDYRREHPTSSRFIHYGGKSVIEDCPI